MLRCSKVFRWAQHQVPMCRGRLLQKGSSTCSSHGGNELLLIVKWKMSWKMSQLSLSVQLNHSKTAFIYCPDFLSWIFMAKMLASLQDLFPFRSHLKLLQWLSYMECPRSTGCKATMPGWSTQRAIADYFNSSFQKWNAKSKEMK